ncbi:hypothetical protein [Calothrix sp. NIES-2098]|uniref:hypothetical protein n=1 Tax=Calothrix sp. NIES-2098 TaxID=1954171 RepID=UPI000B5DBCE3|nr:hypothetical protein NIES2098_30210 [Calothrix sp. NIES-2098]
MLSLYAYLCKVAQIKNAWCHPEVRDVIYPKVRNLADKFIAVAWVTWFLCVVIKVRIDKSQTVSAKDEHSRVNNQSY